LIRNQALICVFVFQYSLPTSRRPWCLEKKEREPRAFLVGPRNGILEKTKYTPFFGPLELFFGAWGGKGFGRLLGYYYLFLGYWRFSCLLYIYILGGGFLVRFAFLLSGLSCGCADFIYHYYLCGLCCYYI